MDEEDAVRKPMTWLYCRSCSLFIGARSTDVDQHIQESHTGIRLEELEQWIDINIEERKIK